MISGSVSTGTSAVTIPTKNNTLPESGHFNQRNVQNADSRMVGLARTLTECLRAAPNPFSGGMIVAALLFTRSIISTESKAVPSQELQTSETSKKLQDMPPAIRNSSVLFHVDHQKEAILKEIEKNGGEDIHSRLINSLGIQSVGPAGGSDDHVDDDDDDDDDDDGLENTSDGDFDYDEPAHEPERANARKPRSLQERKRSWSPVPQPKGFAKNDVPVDKIITNNYNRFARTDKELPQLVRQKCDPHAEMSDPCDKIIRFTSLDSFGAVHKQKKLSQKLQPGVELTTCFHNKQDHFLSHAPVIINPGFSKISGQFLNDCPEATAPNGELFGSMDIRVPKPGQFTLLRVINNPDRLLFKNPYSGLIYNIPPETSIKTYKSLINNDFAQFEEPGYPPFTINVELFNGSTYLTIKARSNYANYANSHTCDIPFRGEHTAINTGVCCNDEQDVVYLYNEKIKFDDKNGKDKDWTSLKFAIKFSDYNTRGISSDGKIVIWKNDNPIVTTSVRIGSNDHKHLGGGGYTIAFGISETTDPVTIKFKKVRFGNDSKILDQSGNGVRGYIRYIHNIPHNVNGQCQGSEPEKGGRRKTNNQLASRG